MIDSKEVIAFFDRLAPDWDAEMIRSDEIIAAILDKAEVSAGKDVLDVATGTGVLIDDYLARGVASVTGIDISPNMARIAQGKYPQENVKILCGDVERTDFDRLFDCIVQTHPGRQASISSGSKEPRSALESRRVSLGAHWVD